MFLEPDVNVPPLRNIQENSEKNLILCLPPNKIRIQIRSRIRTKRLRIRNTAVLSKYIYFYVVLLAT